MFVRRNRLLGVVVITMLAAIAGIVYRANLPANTNEVRSSGTQSQEKFRTTMSTPNTDNQLTSMSNSELLVAADRRRAGSVLAGGDLKIALQHLGKVGELRLKATSGDLTAVSILLDVASLCAGGTHDLTGKFDLHACMRSFGVRNSREMDRIIADLVGQLANAGFSAAQLEFSQRVMVMVDDGRLNKESTLDVDLISRAQAYLVSLAESGSAESAFSLAQAYMKGTFGSRERQLGIRYAQLARQRDPVRFENVELMLGI